MKLFNIEKKDNRTAVYLFNKKIFSHKTRPINEKTVAKWFNDDGDNTLRLNYNLHSDSLVFDAGGYHGDWTFEINKRYRPNIHVFEPVIDFCEIIEDRMKDCNNVKVNRFALSDKNESGAFQVGEDSSSRYTAGEKTVNVEFKDITEYLKENNIENVDLIKINIEGGEYPLLEKLIKTGDITKFKNIQVQFHNIDGKSKKRMEKIQQALRKTHKLTWQYVFCWENWELK